MSIDGLHPILLIDDNHEDLFLTKRLLARAGIKHPIITIDDGEEAIAFLRAATAQGSQLLPRTIFCDIRMPKIDGFDVLKWARSQAGLAKTPIVILTGGDVPEDRAKAKQLGADYFLVKFPTPDVLKKVIDGESAA